MSVDLRRWDCHAHAFGPAGRFPAVADRGYDPPGVRPAAHLAEAEAAGIGGVVWVQPSIYGGDTRRSSPRSEPRG